MEDYYNYPKNAEAYLYEEVGTLKCIAIKV